MARTRSTLGLLLALGCQGTPVGGELVPDGGSDAGNGDGAAQSGFQIVYADDAAEPGDSLHALWAASAEQVIAVGSDRQIVQFDGIDWDPMVKTQGAHLFGIWGATPTDIVAVGMYAAGAQPAAFYFNGQQWLVGGPFPTDMTLITDAWGFQTQRYFTGLAGHIYQDDPINYPNMRYHTAVITGGCPIGNLESPDLNGIDGNSLTNILAVGDGALMAHRDSSGWAIFCAPDLSVDYASVTLIPGTNEFYIGANYLGLYRWIDRKTPLRLIHEDREDPGASELHLQAVWAASSAMVVAVGDGGTILYYDGGQNGARRIPSPTSETLYGVVGVGDRTLYVCGAGNRIWRGEIPE